VATRRGLKGGGEGQPAPVCSHAYTPSRLPACLTYVPSPAPMSTPCVRCLLCMSPSTHDRREPLIMCACYLLCSRQTLGSAVLGLTSALTNHANTVVDAFAREQTRKVNNLSRALVHSIIDVAEAVGHAATLDHKRTALIQSSLARVGWCRTHACRCSLVGCGLWVVGCGLWVVGYGVFCVAGCWLLVVGCGLWGVSCALIVERCD
jgi:hypothetical protein